MCFRSENSTTGKKTSLLTTGPRPEIEPFFIMSLETYHIILACITLIMYSSIVGYLKWREKKNKVQ